MIRNVIDGKKIEEITMKMNELIKEKKEVDETVQEQGDKIKDLYQKALGSNQKKTIER